jgi:hypothetical protein
MASMTCTLYAMPSWFGMVSKSVSEHAQSHAAHEHDLVQKRSKFPDGVLEQWKVWIRH